MYPTRIGRKIGLLTVLEKTASSAKRDGKHTYLCQCDCGNTVEVKWSSLAKGTKRSCGCLVKAREERFEKLKADGLSRRQHPLGITYRKMVARCTDERVEAYRYYGARGVAVCQRWLDSFQAFVDDVGPKPTPGHTLDRIDPFGNYEPGNVRWASVIEQAENRRKPLRVYQATIKGKTATVAAWCRKLGLSEKVGGAIRKRVAEGASPELELITAAYRKKVWAAGGSDYSECEAKAKVWLAKNNGN